MAIKRVKKKEHENLSDANVEKVIGLLEQEKPITKKDACEILNISYNTTRLKNIVDGHKSRKEHDRKMRDRNRGKKASEDEIKTIITEYLEGVNVSEISKGLFRSASFVKGILDKLGVPQKLLGDEKFSTSILPDECVQFEFQPGQVAWSAKYHAPCEVIAEVPDSATTNYESKYGCKCYRVYVFEALDEPPQYFPKIRIGGFHAVALACDLGSMKHLARYNVKLSV